MPTNSKHVMSMDSSSTCGTTSLFLVRVAQSGVIIYTKGVSKGVIV